MRVRFGNKRKDKFPIQGFEPLHAEDLERIVVQGILYVMQPCNGATRYSDLKIKPG